MPELTRLASRLSRLPNWLPVAASVPLTLGLWIGFQQARSPVVNRCNYNLSADCNKSEMLRADPYCIVDPLCLSPWRATTGPDDTTGQHRGLAILPFDPLQSSDDASEWLASPNMELYSSGIALLLVTALAAHRYRRMQSAALLAITLWCSAEAIRWNVGVSTADALLGSDQPSGLPPSFFLPVALCLLAFIAVQKWRSHAVEQKAH